MSPFHAYRGRWIEACTGQAGDSGTSDAAFPAVYSQMREA
jgi:hypothetical protein